MAFLLTYDKDNLNSIKNSLLHDEIFTKNNERLIMQAQNIPYHAVSLLFFFSSCLLIVLKMLKLLHYIYFYL